MRSLRAVPVLLGLAAVHASCTCERDEPPVRPLAELLVSEAAVAPPGEPSPTAAAASGPGQPDEGLAADPTPILSTPVPLGTRRAVLASPADGGAVERPIANLVLGASMLDVIDFYTRHLEPGTPLPEDQGVQVASLAANPGCRIWAARRIPDCRGTLPECIERVCAEPLQPRRCRFHRQHPLAPGNPAAEVNVELVEVGGEVSITIENQTLLDLVADNAKALEP